MSQSLLPNALPQIENNCPCIRQSPTDPCCHVLPIHYFSEPSEDNPNPKYPCGNCGKNITEKTKAIQCDCCNYWNHIRCDEVTPYSYEKLLKLSKKERDKIIHYCKICKEANIPAQKLSDDEFITSIIKNIEYNEDLNLRICPPNGIKRLFTDFSNRNEDDPLVINCDYYDTTTRIPNQNEKKILYISHERIASLGLHKDELVTALSLLKVKFDIITLSETKIIKGTKPTYDITLPGYKEYSTPTESSKGGVIIYVKEEIEIKRRIDLESTMYEAGKLETVFLEILNEKKKNTIIGCIYRHPTMDVKTFNEKHFNNVITKISTEKKVCYLLP